MVILDIIIANPRKDLSKVTLEDAKEIVKFGYPEFFNNGKWTIEDRTEAIGESCAFMSAKYKSYYFWFFNGSIDINLVEDESIDDINFDIKYQCYIKAHQLGYYVPLLSDLLDAK